MFSYIGRHHIFEPQNRVVAGVSGGADSVCLLFVLRELQKKMPLSLYVVHINHGIRPDAAEDAAFVEKLCESMQLPFYLVRENVRELAYEQHRSEEEMGRIVRYNAFNRIADELHADKIAVAHNMNDKSETMLYNLFRGSGIKGLGSIRPVRDKIVRPLLCLKRSEIEEYLEERGIGFCTDETNEGDDYTRNRIRHHILSYAEQEISGGSIEHIARAADELEEINNYLLLKTYAFKEKCVKKENNGYIFDVEEFQKEAPVIARRLLYELLMELSPHGRDIASVHVAELNELFFKKGNPSVSLPFGIIGRREYNRVFLYRASEMCALEGNLPAALDKSILKFEKFPVNAENNRKAPQKKYTKWFDYDKIEQSLVLRTRQPGDYISIADKSGREIHKPLKEYFINEKIPAADREVIMLLADGAHIVWVIGYRISEHYKVTENTKHILQAQLINACEDIETEDKNGRAN
ncbi:MAG: tRNA lysidine(34) synthetase TilS [Lachnospiraceae bacterium]|nr:tRNA lysidine(34) synthetase TilS [Lachnospiraceae bacterium]